EGRHRQHLGQPRPAAPVRRGPGQCGGAGDLAPGATAPARARRLLVELDDLRRRRGRTPPLTAYRALTRRGRRPGWSRAETGIGVVKLYFHKPPCHSFEKI